ncbi:hypothetical protein RFI_27260, partial [Reticulomyxa filosa]
MKVQVHFGNGEKVVYELAERPTTQLSFIQQHRFSTRLLCELKRKIHKTHNIQPLDQQLIILNSASQDVSSLIFPDVQCVSRVRKPTGIVQVKGKREDTHNLKVDPNDTLLMGTQSFGALCFLFLFFFEPVMKSAFFFFLILFFLKKKKNNNKQKSASVQSLGLVDNTSTNTTCSYWLELPGDDENPHNVIIRSTVELVTYDPSEPNLGYFIRNCCKKHSKLPFLGFYVSFFKIRKKHNTLRTYNVQKKKPKKKKKGSENSMRMEVVENMNLSHLIKLTLGNETKIGICSQNRPEWLLTDFANQTQGFVTVPLYTSLGKNAVEYIIGHAGIQLVICDVDVVPVIVEAKAHCPSLKYIVVMDAWPTDQQWLSANRYTFFF